LILQKVKGIKLKNLIYFVDAMRIMIPFADGFEDIEAFTIVDILRRAGISVDMVGIMGSVIKSSNGVRVMTDKKLTDVNADEYDGIVLPGGSAYEIFGRTKPLLDMLKRLNSQGKLIGAICASPSVLAKAGVLEGKRATIFPGMEREIPYPRAEKVVIDGNVITSQAPGTAMEFALRIVEVLVGRERAYQIRKQLVV